MATVLVTGGSGTLGRHLVGVLRQHGHDVRVLSRRVGVGTHQGNLVSGDGVHAAVQGARWVVHAATGRRDVDQTRHLLEASKEEVEHLVYVSIVGIDAIPFWYYRQKLRCEGLVEASGTPFTILRATQFHELLARGLRALAKLPVAPLPAQFRFQPVAAKEVAGRLAEVVELPPISRADDFGGPEVLELGEIARLWQERKGRPKHFARVTLPGRVAGGFREGRNTCPDHRHGKQTWQDFLAEPST